MQNGRDSRAREQVDRLGRPAVEMLDREIARQERKEGYRRLVRGVLLSLFVATALIVLVTNLWVTVLRIDGPSMLPLLEMDEIVCAVKTGNLKKNDIAAFAYNNQIHVKRVVATAGDWVGINEDGAVLVNGEVLDEPYVTELNLGDCDITLPLQVPSGAIFVLGDNRPISKDSRDSRIGPVSREQIMGIVKFRIWPLSRIASVS